MTTNNISKSNPQFNKLAGEAMDSGGSDDTQKWDELTQGLSNEELKSLCTYCENKLGGEAAEDMGESNMMDKMAQPTELGDEDGGA